MHIVITGGAGFLGARLARSLLAMGTLSQAGAPAQAVVRITLVDRAAPPPDLLSDARVHAVTGDLLALLEANSAAGPVVTAQSAIIFHLAAAVSGECEADFDLGLRSNLDATRQLVQACRALQTCPTVVFASSLAVYGSAPGQALPAVVEDDTLPTPQNSYGTQKFMCEQLLADAGRKGYIRARTVRLMTVSVRPGKPNGAASSFLSGMLREPLAGRRSTCPVPPDTPVALASPARSIEGLLCAAQMGDTAWGPRTAVNLPALTTTPAQMAAALQRVAGHDAVALIDWTVDPAVSGIVTRWPARFDSARARALGLQPDADFDSILRDYVRENPDAVAYPISA